MKISFRVTSGALGLSSIAQFPLSRGLFSFILHNFSTRVLLDSQHDLPELAWFFVLRHVRGLLEPDQLLAFGGLERLIILLGEATWGDIVVSALEQKDRD